MNPPLKGFKLVERHTPTERDRRRNEAEGWARQARAIELIRGLQMLAYGASLQPPGKRDVADLVMARIAAYSERETALDAAYEALGPGVEPEPQPIRPARAQSVIDFLSEYTGASLPSGRGDLFRLAFATVTNNDLFDDGLETQARRGAVLEILCEQAVVDVAGFREVPSLAHRKEDSGAN